VPQNILQILGTAGQEGTGIASTVAALSRGLNPDRYRVHAWFLAGDGPLASELRSAGACVRVVDWTGGARDPMGAWRFWREIHGQDFAIVHQHFGNRAPRSLVRAGSQAKIITHLWMFDWRALDTVPLHIDGADLIIATSQAVADCVVGGSARVVYPGTDAGSEVRPCPAGMVSKTDLVVGTLARLVPMKGIVYLIRALAALNDVPKLRLEIAGSGPERLSLEREVQVNGLSDRVCFLGWRTDVAALLARWDVYVQPSLGEPFGIAALEAMTASLPVVGTSAGGLAELVEHGRTGWLVPPCDPVALADRLRALLVDQTMRHRMGAAGRERAKQAFTNDRMVGMISDIYDEVLRGTRALEMRVGPAA
jgi:glycosyltransferase involved in cell wall biosynthesis